MKRALLIIFALAIFYHDVPAQKPETQKTATQKTEAQQPEVAKPSQSSPASEPQSSPASQPQAVKPVVTEAAGRGLAIMIAARKAIGEQALKELRDLEIKSEAELTDSGISSRNDSIIKLPDKMLTNIKSDFGEITQCYNGVSAWRKSPRGVDEFTGAAMAIFREQLINETVFLLGNFDAQQYQTEYLGEQPIGAERAHMILIKTPFEYEVTLFIDTTTLMVVRKRFTVKVSGKSIESEESYRDFREVMGLKLPFKRLLSRNGAPFADITISEIKLNIGAPDSLFDKPAK